MMQGEMWKVGQWLHAGIMAALRAETSELKGSAPAGEDRVIRETCRVTEKVTETVTRTLKGEESTSTRETRREVTELTETREVTREKVVERLHGVEEKDGVVGRAHTHTQVARDNEGGLAERVGTRCGVITHYTTKKKIESMIL